MRADESAENLAHGPYGASRATADWEGWNGSTCPTGAGLRHGPRPAAGEGCASPAGRGRQAPGAAGGSDLTGHYAVRQGISFLGGKSNGIGQ